jgi:hypothetical protein
MQRPVMNPMYLDDPPPRPRDRWKLLRIAWRICRVVLRICFKEIRLGRRRADLRIEDGTPAQRIVRGILYRLAFAPVILAMFVAALVFAGTHPQRIPADNGEPRLQALYYNPVNMISPDGTQLEGMVFPQLDARRVIEQRDSLLRAKFPAVVLVHDYAHGPGQMLPMVRPLHEAGYVVLVVGVRGRGTGRLAGQTFGLHESLDVQAAVHMLRRRAFVDPSRIALLGVGSGANAVMLCGQSDPQIAAIVACNPLPSGDDAVRRYLGPQQPWLQFLQPLCKFAFELSYGLDIDEIDVEKLGKQLEARALLRLDLQDAMPVNARASQLRTLCTFLDRHVKGEAPLQANVQ